MHRYLLPFFKEEDCTKAFCYTSFNILASEWQLGKLPLWVKETITVILKRVLYIDKEGTTFLKYVFVHIGYE